MFQIYQPQAYYMEVLVIQIFISLGNSQGSLYNYKYSLFSSLVLSHPYGMQFAITNNVPPLITTNSNIIMTLDGSLGVDINQSLTVEQNISISGYSSFYAPITTNITCNKSLYVSSSSNLNSTLFVSGSTTLNSYFL